MKRATSADIFPDLSVRTRHALWRAGLRTRGELMALASWELSMFRCVGNKAWFEIFNCVRAAPENWPAPTRTPRVTVLLLLELLAPHYALTRASLRDEVINALLGRSRGVRPALRKELIQRGLMIDDELVTMEGQPRY